MAPASRRIQDYTTQLTGEECYDVLHVHVRSCSIIWLVILHHIKGPLSGRCQTACTLIFRPEAGREGFSELI